MIHKPRCGLDPDRHPFVDQPNTPRIANRLLRRVCDYAEVKADGRITAQSARALLNLLEVDTCGLEVMDRRMIEALIQRFGGGPVGLNTLVMAVGEEADTMEEFYETMKSTGRAACVVSLD